MYHWLRVVYGVYTLTCFHCLTSVMESKYASCLYAIVYNPVKSDVQWIALIKGLTINTRYACISLEWGIWGRLHARLASDQVWLLAVSASTVSTCAMGVCEKVYGPSSLGSCFKLEQLKYTLRLTELLAKNLQVFWYTLRYISWSDKTQIGFAKSLLILTICQDICSWQA